MLGNNDRLSRIDRPATLSVKEVFYTIQGEGPLAGSPAVFVRMAGCHLACYFCDTDFSGGTDYSPLSLCNEIVEKADGRTNLVVFTGGEPLRQNLGDIFTMLDGDWRVQIETAGTFWWDWMNLVTWEYTRKVVMGSYDSKSYLGNNHQIVCSPKTANIHPKIAQHANAFKYIIRHYDMSLEDGLPIYSTQTNPGISPEIETVNLFRPDSTVPIECIYVQPMDLGNEGLNENSLSAAKHFSLKHGYRLSLQIHKFIGMR